jgi:hypothetical protein
MLSGPPRLVPFIFVAFILALVVWYYHGVAGTGAPLSTWKPGSSSSLVTARPASLRPGIDPLDFSVPLRFSDGPTKPAGSNYTFKIVVPKTVKEDLNWMAEEIPHAPLVVYEVDNDKAEHKIPKNKGREAMVRCAPFPARVLALCRGGYQRMHANPRARYTSATSSITTTTCLTRRCSCTPTAMPGTTTS